MSMTDNCRDLQKKIIDQRGAEKSGFKEKKKRSLIRKVPKKAVDNDTIRQDHVQPPSLTTGVLKRSFDQ